jgi:hypothetical protein
LWLQESTRISSLLTNSPRQMEHSRGPGRVWIVLSAGQRRPLTITGMLVFVSEVTIISSWPIEELPPLTVVDWVTLAGTVHAASTSLSATPFASLLFHSANLTIGMLSSIALVRPCARFWFSLPGLAG